MGFAIATLNNQRVSKSAIHEWYIDVVRSLKLQSWSKLSVSVRFWKFGMNQMTVSFATDMEVSQNRGNYSHLIRMLTGFSIMNRNHFGVPPF